MPKFGGRRKKRRTHAGSIPEGATVLADSGSLSLKGETDVPKSIVALASKVKLATKHCFSYQMCFDGIHL